MISTERYDRSSPPSQPPRLCYFISRSNGNIVPLIPADELPYSVKLMGVPRAMKMEHSCGMHHVGTHPFTGQHFKLDPGGFQHVTGRTDLSPVTSDICKPVFPATDAVLRRNEQGKPTTGIFPRTEQAVSRLPVSATASNWRKTEDPASARSQVIIDNIVAQGSRSPVRQPQTALRASRTPTSSPGSSFEQRHKIYCSYWIRSGECDYTQQGCRYKHEMPDKRTLASIGFRTVPRWWQEKVAIQLGRSAIPTVGPVMKPAKWLKQRRLSHDSQSDEEDRSELGSEAEGGEESDVDAVSPTKSGPQHSATAIDPAAEKSDEMAVLLPERKEECPDKVVTRASTNTTPETVSQPRWSLPDGDLIDLSPISPTQTSSCNSDDTATLEIIGNAKPSPGATPVPPLPGTERKPPVTLPRKVFVPAGELSEFHVADARKHAEMQKPKLKPSIEARQCQTRDSNEETQPATISLSISKGADMPKAGLRSSMHAPQSACGESPCSNRPSTVGRSLQRQPTTDSPPPTTLKARGGRTKTDSTVTRDCSRSGSETTKAPKSTIRKAEAVDGRNGVSVVASSSRRQTPKGICRPRRPATSGPRTVVPRVGTATVKE